MFDKTVLRKSISEAKNGNEIARENLISYYKPFIINTVGHLSNKYIIWSNEEASIGLLAFNRAINTYDNQGGRSFLNYAYLLIKRDLIDYHRREKRQQHFSLNHIFEENNNISNKLEIDKSFESFHKEEEAQELVDEILELNQHLNLFDISFEELERCSPKHNDTRKTLFEMTARFVEKKEFVQFLLMKKRFPITSFAEETGYRTKTIERHKKYLIALIILKLNPQWVHLSQYIKDSSRKEECL